MATPLPKLGSAGLSDPPPVPEQIHENYHNLQGEPANTSSASSVNEDDKQMVCHELADSMFLV
jgi:hypothetical protein